MHGVFVYQRVFIRGGWRAVAGAFALFHPSPPGRVRLSAREVEERRQVVEVWRGECVEVAVVCRW